MTLSELLIDLKKKEVKVKYVEGQLKIQTSKGKLPADLLQNIKKRKPELVELLKSRQNADHQDEIVAIDKCDYYPVSHSQKRFWLLDKIDEAKTAYNLFTSYHIDDLHIGSLENALIKLVNRHEILRTTFKEVNLEPFQIINASSQLDYSIALIDLSEAGDSAHQAHKLAQKAANFRFDLSKGPLIRLKAVKIDDNKFILFLTIHHIIGDGWSMDVLYEELSKLYIGERVGKEIDLPELDIQYKDFAAWQIGFLNGKGARKSQRFWMNQFQEDIPVLELPTSFTRPPVKTYRGSSLEFNIKPEVVNGLKKFAQAKGGTLFMSLMAVLKLLLHKYSGQHDIVIGTPVAGRENSQLDKQIGPYINTLAIRTNLSFDHSFEQLLEQVILNTTAAFEHQIYPFDRLIEDLSLHGEVGRSELFNVMIIHQNTRDRNGDNERSKSNGRGKKRSRAELTSSKFDLTVHFKENGSDLYVNIEYSTDLFSQEFIVGFIQHFNEISRNIVNNTQVQIADIDYLPQKEKHQLQVTFNDTTIPYPKEKTIVDLFEEQAAKSPMDVAIVFEDTELTYQALDEMSNKLAHYIKDGYEINPDDLIAIILERSEWLIVSMLAVLKSGGAYVPIDPEYPQDRIETILEDSRCKIQLDQVELAKFQKSMGAFSEKPVTTATTSSNLAYVIYTSGSTGKPKGVMIEHKNVTNFFTGMTSIFGKKKGTFLSTTNFTFDISVLELLWTLYKGYKVVIQGDAMQIYEEKNDYSVYAQIRKHKVTHIQITPSMGSMLNQHLSDDKGWKSIKHILLGGEPLTASLVNDIYQKLPNTQLYNMYGPTETTVWSSVSVLEKNIHKIEVGKPIANTKIYILDKTRNPVGAGIQGELYIGGDGVARGYTDKTLTKLSFIENPFLSGDRLYRTGDFGSWSNSGTIYLDGRKDQQVKIRGHRIELGEIEHALEQNNGINQAVVLAKTNKSGEKELVAYITANVEQNITGLRTFLQQTLPAYMLPAYFVQLEVIPLTVSGKVDKLSLPDPEGLGISTGVEYVAPGTELEETLVKIWEEILQRENIGVNDDFFHIRGNSILLMRVRAQIAKILSVELTIQEMFKSSTIKQICALIQSKKITGASGDRFKVTVNPSNNENLYEALKFQTWRFLDYKKNDYVPSYLLIEQKLSNIDVSAMSKAVETLVSRHESLRTLFIEKEEEQVFQKICHESKFKSNLLLIDISLEDNKDERIQSITSELRDYLFDFEKEPSFKCRLIKYSTNEYVLLFTIDHMISDGHSRMIIMQELGSLYHAYSNGLDNPLEPLRLQLKDYSEFHRQHYFGEKKAHHEKYFKKLFNKLPPRLSIEPSQILDRQLGNQHKTKRSKNAVDKKPMGGGYFFLVPKNILDQIESFTSDMKMSFFI